MNNKIQLYVGDNKCVIDKINSKFNIIYLDPPYNTKSKNLLYKDNINHEKWKEDFINLLWKIKLKCEEKAVIYCSIGNQELANAKISLDLVFGEKSFVSIMPRQTISVAKTTKRISNIHDYLLIYQLGNVKFNGSAICTKIYKFVDKHLKERGKFHLRRLDYSSFRYTRNLDYKLVIDGKSYYPNDKKSYLERKVNHKKFDWEWIWSKERANFAYKNDFLVVKQGNVYKKTYEKCTIEGDKKNGFKIEKAKVEKTFYFASIL